MSLANDQLPEYPHLSRLLHWVLTASLAILIATGLSLHAAARPDWSVFSGVVPEWMWRGRVYLWHYWAAAAFFPAVLGMLALLWRRSFWQRATHIILIGGGLVMIATGLWMMFSFGSIGSLKLATGLHAAIGLVVLPLVFLWHAIGGLTFRVRYLVASFRPLKNPRWAHLAAFAPVVLLTTWVLFEGWPLHPSWRSLIAKRIEPRQIERTELPGLPWESADPLNVRLLNGAGLQSGQSELVLRALHDGSELFLCAEWDDPIADFNYWPWKKTEQGWERLQTSSKDETVYYEDKFSIIIPIRPSWLFDRVGCAVYCHLDGGNGWGYKGGRPDCDVWHWKSARTDPTGQADDKYWSIVDFNNEDFGRHGDPSEGGGYETNASADGTRPAWLPDDMAAVRHGMIPRDHAVAYTEELGDRIKPGALIPGLVCSPFLGDRGQVACFSEHRQGRWTVYLRRALDTGSPHDVRLQPGSAYSFGCAAFDHAGKRHAYSMPVFRLVLAP